MKMTPLLLCGTVLLLLLAAAATGSQNGVILPVPMYGNVQPIGAYNTYVVYPNNGGSPVTNVQATDNDNINDAEWFGPGHENVPPITTTETPCRTEPDSDNYPMDESRHICAQQQTIIVPVKTTEVYTRPTWKQFNVPCQPPTDGNEWCVHFTQVYEPAYRDVIKQQSAQQMTYDCCAGWSRETPSADACMKPVCTTRYQNGGNCTAPQTCSCPAGFSGRYCEQHLNICETEKPCDQQCINTAGSYYCGCRQGFVLQTDQHSCRKTAVNVDDVSETRDMENDVDDQDTKTLLQATYSDVHGLKNRVDTLEKQAQDVNLMQANLNRTEDLSNKLEGIVNWLIKCRNGTNANCPLIK